MYHQEDANRYVRKKIEARGRGIFFVRVLNFLDVIDAEQYKHFFMEFKKYE